MTYKKNIVIFTVILIVAVISSLLFIVIQNKIKTKKAFIHLPEVEIITVKNEKYLLKPTLNHKTLIIFFSTECEYCIYEYLEISKNQTKFRGTRIIFISPDDICEIIKFKQEYSSTEFNPEMYHCDGFTLYKTFNIKQFPSIFIYNESGILISDFNNTLSINKLINETSK